MDKVKYSLTPEQKMYFSSVLIMDIINEDGTEFPVILSDKELRLDMYLLHMAEQGWLKVVGGKYIPTEDGVAMLLNHKQKLVEFRALYKIYCAVDLGKGEFGYDKYFDFDTDEEFIEYINQEQFEDMRVAVCEFKKINPLEVIFLEMFDSGKFGLDTEDWVYELVTSKTWDLMVSIANDNVHVDDLIEYDENNKVTATGEQVMEIILARGSELSKNLLKQQQEFDKNNAAVEEEEVEETVITETTTTTTTEYIDTPYYDYTYYDPYYDPYYVSPCWLLLWY